jgi:hypothetical protein
MRPIILAVPLIVATSLAPSAARAQAAFDLAVRLPSVAIGISVPAAPVLVPVPGLAVSYAPRMDANYFYADGRYWVLGGDRWYVSSRCDGPWAYVAPAYVPRAVLSVPVRYYHRPPAYFAGWRADRAPRWSEHWGRSWAEPRPAPRGWERGVAVHEREVWHDARGRERGDDHGRGGEHGDGRKDHGRDDHGRGHDDR